LGTLLTITSAPGAIKNDIIANPITLRQYDKDAITATHPNRADRRPEEIAAGIHRLFVRPGVVRRRRRLEHRQRTQAK
jgi:hypothetical protein